MQTARRVLIAVWAARERARTTDNANGLRHVDTAVELERELGVTADARKAGLWSLRVQRPFGPNLVAVPRRSGFPQSFLAAVQTSGEWALSPTDHRPSGIETDLLVFSRASAAATWRVAMETRYRGPLADLTGGHQTANLASVSGYSPPAPQPGWTNPRRAIAELARYYQHYADHGTAPPNSPFRPGYWTTGQGERLSAEGLSGQIGTQGFRTTLRYGVDSRTDPVYEFNVHGTNITCGTVRGLSFNTPANPGGYLYQTRSRQNWGGWLAPGPYSEISNSIIHQVCLAIAPTPAGGITAISGDDPVSQWKATGKPLLTGPAE